MQAALSLAWHVPHALELGQSVLLPLLTTVVYVYVDADARDAAAAAGALWERILERAWAVIAIDFLVGFIYSYGYVLTSTPDVLYIVLGIFALGLCALLLLADASASVDDDVTAWTVIPRALLRSVAFAWNAATLVRVLAILSLSLLLTSLETALTVALEHAHVWEPIFWANVPLQTFATVPIAALTVLVYNDGKSAALDAREP